MARAETSAAPIPVRARSGPARRGGLLAAAILCALLFAAVTAYVFDPARDGASGPAGFDRPLAEFLQQHRTPALTGRVIEVSALGSAPVLAVLALLAGSVIVRARDWLGLLHFAVTVVGGSVWSRLLQGVFDRARPDNLVASIVVTPGSYPSAHLFGATACYVMFAFFYARYVHGRGAALAAYAASAVIVLCIGLTRVYLGAHHATDVLGGIAAGAAWAFLVTAVFSAWYRPAARASG